MGKLVNVVLWDGRTVSVPEEDAQKLGQVQYGHTETDEEANAAGAKRALEEGTTTGDKLKAAGEGLLDTVTGGGYGLVRRALGSDEGTFAMQRDALAAPNWRKAGEAVALLSPTGLFGDTAKVAGEASFIGGAARAGEAVTKAVGSKLIGRAAEGALFGAGAHIATTNVTGDPLTIEGTAEAAGIGSLLNVGFGAAADKIGATGQRAKQAADEAGVVEKNIAKVKEGRDLFNNPPESWKSFQDAVAGKIDSQQELYDLANKATEKYTKFIKSGQLGTAVTRAENAINTVSKYWRDDAVEAATAATSDSSGLGFDVSDVPVEQPPATPPPVDTRQPISDEMKARLKGYRDRLRKIDQLRNGGWNVDATANTKYGPTNWVKDPSVPADPARATEELRKLQDDLQRDFPKATRRANMKPLPETPPAPGSVLPPENVEIPDSLNDFARKQKPSVDKLAAFIKSDPTTSQAWEKFAGDMGIDPNDGIGGLHNRLSGYIKANDELIALAQKAEQEEGKGGLIAFLRKALKKSVQYGFSRAADAALGGGWLGAAGRVLAGEGARAGMTAAEDTMIGGALLNGKLGIQAKVNELIGKYAVPTAKLTRQLGPVTDWLGQSFVTGERDKEKDLRQLAVNRMNEIAHTSVTAPDSLFLGLSPLMGHPSDAGWKLHSHVMNAVLHLQQTMPKDPGLAMSATGSNWLPSYYDTIALAHRIEAVKDPITALARSIAGDGHPAANETLWQVWPNTLNHAAQEVGFHAPQLTKLKYEQGSGYRWLAPLTGLQSPAIAVAIQGLYLPKPQQAAQQSKPRNPPGRPGAVQSPVAGSSVTSLLSQ